MSANFYKRRVVILIFCIVRITMISNLVKMYAVSEVAQAVPLRGLSDIIPGEEVSGKQKAMKDMTGVEEKGSGGNTAWKGWGKGVDLTAVPALKEFGPEPQSKELALVEGKTGWSDTSLIQMDSNVRSLGRFAEMYRFTKVCSSWHIIMWWYWPQ